MTTLEGQTARSMRCVLSDIRNDESVPCCWTKDRTTCLHSYRCVLIVPVFGGEFTTSVSVTLGDLKYESSAVFK
jgi:hypothetical protein